MAAITTPTTTIARPGIQIQVPAWAWFAMAVAMVGAYLMLSENGLLLSNWAMVHEFFHDGRHALGVPCH